MSCVHPELERIRLRYLDMGQHTLPTEQLLKRRRQKVSCPLEWIRLRCPTILRRGAHVRLKSPTRWHGPTGQAHSFVKRNPHKPKFCAVANCMTDVSVTISLCCATNGRSAQVKRYGIQGKQNAEGLSTHAGSTTLQRRNIGVSNLSQQG